MDTRRTETITITTVEEFDEALRMFRESLIKYLDARAFLTSTVSFKDIISDDDQGSILVCYDSGKKQEAAGMFIDALLQSQDKTKWGVFRDNLEGCEGFQLIKDILYAGKTPSLITHEEEDKILQLKRGKILNMFDAELMNERLLQDGILDTQAYQEVQSVLRHKGNIQANSLIISMGQKRKNFLQQFSDILWEFGCKSVVKELNPDYFEKLNDEWSDDDQCKQCHLDGSACEQSQLEYTSLAQTKDKSCFGESDHGDDKFQDEDDRADERFDEKSFHSVSTWRSDDSSGDKRSRDASKIRNDSVLTDNLNNLDDGPVSSRTRSKTKLLREKCFPTTAMPELEMSRPAQHRPVRVCEQNKLQLQSDVHDIKSDRSQLTPCQMTASQQYYSSQSEGLATSNLSSFQELGNQYYVTSNSDGLTTLNIPPHYQKVQNYAPHLSIGQTDLQYQSPQHREYQHSPPIFTELTPLHTPPFCQPEHEQFAEPSTHSLTKKDTNPVGMNQDRENINKPPTSQRSSKIQCSVCGSTFVSADQLRAHRNTNCTALKPSYGVSPSDDFSRNRHNNKPEQCPERESKSLTDITAIHKSLKPCSCGKRFTSEDALKRHQTTDCKDTHSDNYAKGTPSGVRSDHMHNGGKFGSKSLVSTPQNRAESVRATESEETAHGKGLIKQERRPTPNEGMTRDVSQPRSGSEVSSDLRSDNRGNSSDPTAQKNPMQNIRPCKCGKRFVSSDALKRHQDIDCKLFTNSRPSEESIPIPGWRSTKETSKKTQSEDPPSGAQFMETLNQDPVNYVCLCGQEFSSEEDMIIHNTTESCAKKVQHQTQAAPTSHRTQDTADTNSHEEVQDDSITQLKQPYQPTQNPAADTQSLPPTFRQATSNPTLGPANRSGSREPRSSRTAQDKSHCNAISGMGFQSPALLKYRQQSDEDHENES